MYSTEVKQHQHIQFLSRLLFVINKIMFSFILRFTYLFAKVRCRNVNTCPPCSFLELVTYPVSMLRLAKCLRDQNNAFASVVLRVTPASHGDHPVTEQLSRSAMTSWISLFLVSGVSSPFPLLHRVSWVFSPFFSSLFPVGNQER